MSIYHKHHIIPRHMGGTDDPSNLVEVTIETHANLHKQLWEEFGQWQDRVAYLGLLKMIDDQEIIRIKQSEGAKLGIKLYPEKHSLGGQALWRKEGMREHLSNKRKEQSANGKNPMSGKTHNRVTCIFCKKETAVNTLASNHKKCK